MKSSSRYALGCLLAGCLSMVSAATVTQSGTFSSDSDMRQYSLDLSQSSNVQIYTTSYATGGFVPVLSLFNAVSGSFIAVDGASGSCSNGRMADPSTGICDDAFLSLSLTKGMYSVVLTEFDNFPNGSNISAGFSEMGNGNFTAASCLGASGPFWETDLAPCVHRTGNFSVTTSTTATPEPATGWLMLPVLAFAGFQFRRSRVRA